MHLSLFVHNTGNFDQERVSAPSQLEGSSVVEAVLGLHCFFSGVQRSPPQCGAIHGFDRLLDPMVDGDTDISLEPTLAVIANGLWHRIRP